MTGTVWKAPDYPVVVLKSSLFLYSGNLVGISPISLHLGLPANDPRRDIWLAKFTYSRKDREIQVPTTDFRTLRPYHCMQTMAATTDQLRSCKSIDGSVT